MYARLPTPRVAVTVKRNDVKPRGFKRWTVYVGNVAAFDIEAQNVNGGSLVHVIDGNRKTLACFDSRAGTVGAYHAIPTTKRKA